MGRPDLSVFDKVRSVNDYAQMQQEFDMRKQSAQMDNELRKAQIEQMRNKVSDVETLAKQALMNYHQTGQMDTNGMAALKTMAALEGQKTEYKPDALGNVHAYTADNPYAQALSGLGMGGVQQMPQQGVTAQVPSVAPAMPLPRDVGGKLNLGQGAGQNMLARANGQNDFSMYDGMQPDPRLSDNGLVSDSSPAGEVGSALPNVPDNLYADGSPVPQGVNTTPIPNITNGLDQAYANSPEGKKAIGEAIVKNNAQASSPDFMMKAKELGLKDEEARQIREKALLASQEIENVVSGLLDENGNLRKGADEVAGGAFGLQGRQSASFPVTENQRKYQPFLEQLKGQAFLQAFASMRGAGQISNIEGTKATEAIIRNQQYQSDADFAASLRDLRDYSRRVRSAVFGERESQPTANGGAIDYREYFK